MLFVGSDKANGRYRFCVYSSLLFRRAHPVPKKKRGEKTHHNTKQDRNYCSNKKLPKRWIIKGQFEFLERMSKKSFYYRFLIGFRMVNVLNFMFESY